MEIITEYVRKNDHKSMAQCVLLASPTGEASAAIAFLEHCIDLLRDSPSKKRRNDNSRKNEGRSNDEFPTAFSSSNSANAAGNNSSTPSEGGKIKYFHNDSTDQLKITLALQYPSDSHLMSYLIGAKGQSVLTIGRYAV